MAWIGAPIALTVIVIVLVDAFEALILPRRVSHRYRLARWYYYLAWHGWTWVATRMPSGRTRHNFLGVFGPASLFGLIVLWASGLIFGFALLHWSLGMELAMPNDNDRGLGTYLYFSGTTFFTLGYGDVVPLSALGRALSVIEAGMGFGFLAIVISYLPILYQAFSRREVTISLLDARAGSPPTAAELLRRLAASRGLEALGPTLEEWERWCAELLESQLSYPVLSYYRSQHDNQSWVGTLTTILDVSALVIAAGDGGQLHQARLTFAMARHAAVDLGLVAQAPPMPPPTDRLPAGELSNLLNELKGVGMEVKDGPAVTKALADLRALYEPFIHTLAIRYEFLMPRFLPDKPPVDNWQTSAWMRRSPGLANLAAAEDDHFD